MDIGRDGKCKFSNFAGVGRILALDIGSKRTGIAVSDEMQIIATPLETIAAESLLLFLKKFLASEKVDCIVVGEPKDMQNRNSDASKFIDPMLTRIQKAFPSVTIERYDERFTSKMAFQAMIDGGLGKQKRRDKALVDKLSATIILRDYLESIKNSNKRK